MSDKKIDGKGLALSLRAQMAEEVSALTPKLGRPPGLGVLLVGDDAASQVYVRNKELAATKAGMHSSIRRLPATATQEEVLEAVHALNNDETIDGFLVQLPSLKDSMSMWSQPQLRRKKMPMDSMSSTLAH